VYETDEGEPVSEGHIECRNTRVLLPTVFCAAERIIPSSEAVEPSLRGERILPSSEARDLSQSSRACEARDFSSTSSILSFDFVDTLAREARDSSDFVDSVFRFRRLSSTLSILSFDFVDTVAREARDLLYARSLFRLCRLSSTS
jgi:hypothetical protein